MFFYNYFLAFLLMGLTISCEHPTSLQAVNGPIKVIPRTAGPHAISFTHFVTSRPFIASQHFTEMHEKGATFYKDGVPIRFKELKQLLQKSSLQHIETVGSTSNTPKVVITLQPTRDATEKKVDYVVKTDPAAALDSFIDQNATFYIGKKQITIEEAQKEYRSSKFPVQMFTAQIDDQPLLVIINNGC